MRRLRALRGSARWRQLETPLVVIGLLCLLVYGLQPFGLGGDYESSVIVLAGIYLLLALGLNVVVGYAGLLDLGYAGFWAIGAYSTAWITGKTPFHPFHLDLIWAIPVGMTATIIGGLILGVVTLRVRGDYLAIVTLGFGEIVRIIANSWDPVTGGPSGVTDIPHPNILGYDFGLDPRPYVLLLAVLVAIAILIVSNLWNSRIGRAWFATKQDERAAEASGVATFRMKLLAFATGASTAGLAGVMYSSYVGYISPDNFVILVAILVLAAVVLGGMGRTSGVALGAVAVVILPEVFRDFEQARFLVFGGVLIAVMALRPAGLLPARRRTYPLAQLARRDVSPPSQQQTRGLADGRQREVTAPVFECRDLSKRFGGLSAVSGVSFKVRPGLIFGVIGPNGAGKSTLFDLITGMTPPTRGSVLFDGLSLAKLQPHEITRLGIARTFQIVRLVGEASVVENVLLGADVHNRASLPETIFRMPTYRQTERAALAKVMGVLELCGIDRLANDAASGLSYGDQRRVEIARALATDPKLLLLDEPAAGMNLTEKARLRDLVGEIRMRGVTVLLIEHDMSLLMRISDEVLVLDHGVVIGHGTPQEVRSDRAVIEAYLGTDAA